MNATSGGFLPVAALLYAATFWGFLWFPARLLEQAGIAGLWQLLISYLSALLVLTLLSYRCWQRLRGQWAALLGLALAAGWTNVSFVLAVLSHEVVRVLILFYLSPLWASLLGHWLLGERLRPLIAAMVALGLGGALVILWRPAMFTQPLGQGDLLALSSGMGFALTNVLTRYLREVDTVSKTLVTWVGVVGVAGLLILLWQTPMPAFALSTWGGAALLGLAGFMLATLCTVYAVSRMPVQRSSVIMLFEVLVGALSAWWLAGEQIGASEWVGGAMIIGAGLVAALDNSGRKTP